MKFSLFIPIIIYGFDYLFYLFFSDFIIKVNNVGIFLFIKIRNESKTKIFFAEKKYKIYVKLSLRNTCTFNTRPL